MQTQEHKQDGISLKNNRIDFITAALKSVVGIIPRVGNALSELVSLCIPNQRMDRVGIFLEKLAMQIAQLEEQQNEWIEKLNSSKGNLLLFELAIRYSAETNSETLHHCYAYYVFNAVHNKTLEDSRSEKLLRTLSELTEEEVIHLINFSEAKVLFTSSEFDEKYEEILMPKSRSENDEENDIHNAFRDEYIITLEQKGLVTIVMKNSGTKFPIGTNDVSITDYGELLVKAVYDESFFGKMTR